VEARFDDILARAVCKIAFNYMAKTQGAEFALRREFDAARRYIRYAEGKGGGFLTFDRETRFRSSTGETREHLAHLLTLEGNGEREELIGIVHLFGATKYAVCLRTKWDGIWRRIMSGHLFDLEDMEVTELHVTTIAPPWAGVPVMRRPGRRTRREELKTRVPATPSCFWLPLTADPRFSQSWQATVTLRRNSFHRAGPAESPSTSGKQRCLHRWVARSGFRVRCSSNSATEPST
jgi:hypothetical protein